MPYEVTWLIEDQVVYNRNWGAGTEAEMRGAIREVAALIISSSHPLVHVLNDSSDVTDSLGLSTLVKVIREEPIPKKVGWLLTVQVSHPVAKFFMDVTSQMTKQRYRTFSTVAEALEFLKTVDNTIEWEKLPDWLTS